MPTIAGLTGRLRRLIAPTAIDRALDQVHGWTSREQLEYLVRLVRALPDRAVIVELGVWHGRSAVILADACRGTQKHVYGIDPWRSYGAEVDGKGYNGDKAVANSGVSSFDDVFEMFKRHIINFDVGAWVTPIRATGVEAARSWPHGPVSLLFIDASHTYEGVTGDLEAWRPLVGEDGVICGDDWDFPSHGKNRTVERAVRDFLARHPHYRLTLPGTNTWELRRQ